MSQDAIIEKIKKLLRMKRGGTAGEIENALAAAARLAREHGIDLNDVDPNAPDPKPMNHADVILSSRLQDECKYAALVCQNFFNVTSLIMDAPTKSSRRWRDWRIIFIGTDWDREIATYVFEFLTGHFRRCWNRRINKRIRNRRAFMNGIYQGLCQKLRDQRLEEMPDDEVKRGNELLRIDRQVARRIDYMKNVFGETGEQSMKPHSDASTAKWAGWVEGQKTEIRSGLEKSAAQRPALPPAAGQLSML